MSMPDLSVYTVAIDQALREVLSRGDAVSAPLYRMMEYHLGWLDREFQPYQGRQGKRLRPVLCLLACQACGGDWRRALPAACSIELLHNFTLIHDDIEDNSDLRHERATLWNVWGLAQGVNTGDAMSAVSRLAALQLGDNGYSARMVLDVVTYIEETGLSLYEGQYLDISFETRQDVSLSEYRRMIAGKTAALLSAALVVGAMLGGAGDEQINVWGQVGRELGLAFQIIDDILGIWAILPSPANRSPATSSRRKRRSRSSMPSNGRQPSRLIRCANCTTALLSTPRGCPPSSTASNEPAPWPMRASRPAGTTHPCSRRSRQSRAPIPPCPDAAHADRDAFGAQSLIVEPLPSL